MPQAVAVRTVALVAVPVAVRAVAPEDPTVVRVAPVPARQVPLVPPEGREELYSLSPTHTLNWGESGTGDFQDSPSPSPLWR